MTVLLNFRMMRFQNIYIYSQWWCNVDGKPISWKTRWNIFSCVSNANFIYPPSDVDEWERKFPSVHDTTFIISSFFSIVSQCKTLTFNISTTKRRLAKLLSCLLLFYLFIFSSFFFFSIQYFLLKNAAEIIGWIQNKIGRLLL